MLRTKQRAIQTCYTLNIETLNPHDASSSMFVSDAMYSLQSSTSEIFPSIGHLWTRQATVIGRT